jgi:hypothetical protein
MKAFEFSTNVTADHKLIIPEVYSKAIPSGGSVRVILLVEEQSSHTYDQADKQNELPALEAVIAAIKNSPQNPANIQRTSGLLADHLTNSPEEADPAFSAISNLNQENWRVP